MRRLGIEPPKQIDTAAVDAAISAMPPDLVRLCALLTKHSVAEAARVLRIRRQSIYEEHIPAIRRHLTAAGFEFATDFFRTL